MDEHAAFETRAVLAPRRARRSRVALLVPVLVLIGTAWAGLSATRPTPAPEPATADLAETSAAPPPATSVATPVVVVAPRYPAEVLGFAVHSLRDVRLAQLTRDDVIAIAGWYEPLAITDCPPQAAAFRGPTTEVRQGVDPSAYCERSGVLYAARTGLEQRSGDGPSSVNATLVRGVRMPRTLQEVGGDPIPVVVLGHFVESSTACMLLGACPSELVVDYLAWSPSS